MQQFWKHGYGILLSMKPILLCLHGLAPHRRP